MNDIKIRIPDGAAKILRVLEDHGYEAFVVGGCVRDSLLGRNPNDWDITTSALPEEVKSLFHKTIDTGLKHGTVTILSHGEAYEVTGIPRRSLSPPASKRTSSAGILPSMPWPTARAQA